MVFFLPNFLNLEVSRRILAEAYPNINEPVSNYSSTPGEIIDQQVITQPSNLLSHIIINDLIGNLKI